MKTFFLNVRDFDPILDDESTSCESMLFVQQKFIELHQHFLSICENIDFVNAENSD